VPCFVAPGKSCASRSSASLKVLMTDTQGTADVVYSTDAAEKQIKLFVHSKDAQLAFIPGGTHFLSASNPEAINKEILGFVSKY
jgi:pimeloyl-ACP methyl ester carboxylesterase